MEIAQMETNKMLQAADLIKRMYEAKEPWPGEEDTRDWDEFHRCMYMLMNSGREIGLLRLRQSQNMKNFWAAIMIHAPASIKAMEGYVRLDRLFPNDME